MTGLHCMAELGSEYLDFMCFVFCLGCTKIQARFDVHFLACACDNMMYKSFKLLEIICESGLVFRRHQLSLPHPWRHMQAYNSTDCSDSVLGQPFEVLVWANKSTGVPGQTIGPTHQICNGLAASYTILGEHWMTKMPAVDDV